MPYARATIAPPPGRTFVGFFYFIDDFNNYLSYAQQAADGAFVFENKVVIEPHAPALVNLEWWLTGRLSHALGGSLDWAYRALGIATLLGFLLSLQHWFQAAGLSAAHRAPAALLVSTAAGAGGLLLALRRLPFDHCLDLATGLFPVIQILTNPHFLLGTTLLLWGLWAFAVGGPRGQALGVGIGSILALIRPYDFVLLVAIRGLVVVVATPPRRWAAQLLPLAGLIPVVAYNWWLFYLNPNYSFYASTPYEPAATAEMIWALGPASVLACSSLACPPRDDGSRRTRLHLLIWVALGMGLIAAPQVPYSKQFLSGFGLPLLALGAIGLSRFRPAVTCAVAILLSPTLIIAQAIFFRPSGEWYVPVERMETVAELRRACRGGDLLMAEQDLGLLVGARTACKAFVSHSVSPEYERRTSEAKSFFGNADPAWRSALLDANCVTLAALPGDPGPVPRGWLGDGTPFRRWARVTAHTSLYRRDPSDQCRIRRLR